MRKRRRVWVVGDRHEKSGYDGERGGVGAWDMRRKGAAGGGSMKVRE